MPSCKRILGCVLLIVSGLDVARGQSLADFVPEGGVRASMNGDVWRVEGGRGWLRSPRLFSDFAVEFEFRLLAAGTRASFGFRGWPGYGLNRPGYRVSVSQQRDSRVPQVEIEGPGA